MSTTRVVSAKPTKCQRLPLQVTNKLRFLPLKSVSRYKQSVSRHKRLLLKAFPANAQRRVTENAFNTGKQKKSMSLEYEPASEPLHISVK